MSSRAVRVCGFVVAVVLCVAVGVFIERRVSDPYGLWACPAVALVGYVCWFITMKLADRAG